MLEAWPQRRRREEFEQPGGAALRDLGLCRSEYSCYRVASASKGIVVERRRVVPQDMG
ncbi:hypothetical protein J7E70_27820 [Variovorax paradoxus]|nr:hypothetical protein [Variovorax paradoxus]MBT2304246.1 hypothetical protein [Variovorax paradoxus]